jgi:hypothetical protein
MGDTTTRTSPYAMAPAVRREPSEPPGETSPTAEATSRHSGVYYLLQVVRPELVTPTETGVAAEAAAGNEPMEI